MIKKAKFAAMLLSGALLCATAVCATDTVAVNAAGTYLRIPDAADTVIDDAQKTPIKYGNYYFKCDDKGYLCVSTKKSKDYNTLDSYYHSTYTDGKTLYGVNDMKQLCKYDLKTGKKTVLKKFSTKDSPVYSVSAVYKNYVYVTKSSDDTFTDTTYMYNTKTKKLTKVKNSCAIDAQNGKYVAGHSEHRTDALLPYRLTLYKINSDGKLTKIKQLAKMSLNVKFIDNKVYYSSYKDYNTDEGTLYRCDLNVKNKEALATTKGNFVLFGDITEESCVITKDSRTYTYTYGTADSTVYTGKDEWSVIYPSDNFKMNEQDGKTVFTYQKESEGTNTISISYTADKKPKEVLDEKLKDCDPKSIDESEGYWGANNYLAVTRIVAASENNSNMYSQLTALEHKGGTMLIEIAKYEEKDETNNMIISDAIAGLLDTFLLTDN